VKSKLTVPLLIAIATLLTACQSQSHFGLVRFRDGNQANVVLNFNDWNYIFMIRPDYREAGFAQIIRKNELSSAFDQCHVSRELAVVTIGWQYKSKKLAAVTSEWKKILKKNGFQRVAFVHGNPRHLRRSYLIEEVWL